MAVLVAAAFLGGWFTHKETQQTCYVVPGSTNPYLPEAYGAKSSELVCK